VAGAGQIGYPFEPWSIASLLAGQFWAVPLPDGRYACGRVLHVPRKTGSDPACTYTRIFLAGLMDWPRSARPPQTHAARCPRS
jgi:hypothetical protein